MSNTRFMLNTTSSQKKQTFECRSCKNKTACSQLYIPYAAKLLFQVHFFLSLCSHSAHRQLLGTAKYEHRCSLVHGIYRANTRLESIFCRWCGTLAQRGFALCILQCIREWNNIAVAARNIVHNIKICSLNVLHEPLALV